MLPSGIPISKRIEVYNHSGTFEAYVPRLQAVREVREFTADWEDAQIMERIYRRPKALCGKLDQWRATPSGNFLPGFVLSRRERGLRGEPVMQLV